MFKRCNVAIQISFLCYQRYSAIVFCNVRFHQIAAYHIILLDIRWVLQIGRYVHPPLNGRGKVVIQDESTFIRISTHIPGNIYKQCLVT